MYELVRMDEPGKCKEIELLPRTISDWATNAKFTISKDEKWELCSDMERESVLKELLDQPDIIDMVRRQGFILLTMTQVADKCSRRHIIRISGPVQGPAYVYPLRIHPNTKPKSSTFFVTYGADCLIILTVSSS